MDGSGLQLRKMCSCHSIKSILVLKIDKRKSGRSKLNEPDAADKISNDILIIYRCCA